MNKGMVWFQAFLAALQALLQSMHGQPTHSIVAAARATADESMGHIHPSVFGEIKPHIRPLNADPSTTVTEILPNGEDDLEQARRGGAESINAGEDGQGEAEHEPSAAHHGHGSKKKK